MALTLVDRPTGFILGEAFNVAISNAAGAARINFASAHGLATGDIVYIRSNVINYNGRLYASVIDSDTIELKRLETGISSVQFIVEAAVTLYKTTVQSWSAAHLPIKYALRNTKWPNNEDTTTYPIRTASTVNEDGGKIRLLLSGSIGAVDFDFIKVSNSGNPMLDGVYQVFNQNANNYTINVAYSTQNDTDLTGASVQFYFNNYCNKIRIYAGIPPGHIFEDQKPLELISEIAVTPTVVTVDNGTEYNIAEFSIAEILRKQITTQNETLLATLPNNIDFWTGFYIGVAESYDDSDGSEITTTTSAYTNDYKLFYACNAMLEFKNVHSGHMSEYVMNNPSGKFLTLFETPVITDVYQDISFLITESVNGLFMRVKNYLSGVLQSENETSLPGYYEGIYRYEVEPNCSYDQVTLQIIADEPYDLTSFSNVGTGTDWTIDSQPNVTVTSVSGDDSKLLGKTDSFVVGYTYTLNYRYEYTISGGGDGTVRVGIWDSVTPIEIDTYNHSGNGTNVVTGTLQFIYSSGTRIGVMVSDVDAGLISVEIQELLLGQTLSEEKTFEVDCECSRQSMKLTWLNNLGGFDYWTFTDQKEYLKDISESITTNKNVFPEWPKSYGEYANTLKKQTSRTSTNQIVFRQGGLTEDQVTALAYIKSSVLVQIITSREDRRTIIVDSDSFSVFKESSTNKLYAITFIGTYTDDIPVQKV